MNFLSWISEYRRHASGNDSRPFHLFLRLPLTVRERIYGHAGLLRSCPISIEDEILRWSKMRIAHDDEMSSLEFIEHVDPDNPVADIVLRQGDACVATIKHDLLTDLPSDAGCIHPRLPIQLLLVSKQVYTEAVWVLYSRNTILLGPTLPRLPQIALRSLTSLEVRLTACSCVTDHKCSGISSYGEFHDCPTCHFYCKRGAGELLSIKDPSESSSIIQRWYSFCEEFKIYCSKRLRLTIICDCRDAMTARKVVQPLKNFPKIQHATIRLGQSPDANLRAIAEETVRSLIGINTQANFTLFSRLPNEIQELLLSHTDIVAPDYLSWNEPVEELLGGGKPLGNTSKGLRLLSDYLQRCCLQCTVGFEVCACPVRHAASISTICNCWNAPWSLFRVSKAFRQLALKIFFTQNKFVIWETSSSKRRLSGPDYEYLTKPFRILRDMPLDWLVHVRWLRMCFRDFKISDGSIGAACLESWFHFTSMIKGGWKCPLEQLTIELDFAYCVSRNRFVYLERHEGSVAFENFRNITELFKLSGNHRHYKDFFIRIGHYVRSMDEDWARWKFEKGLEKAIMGQQYDAAQRGKYRNKLGFEDEQYEPKVFLRYLEEGDF